LTFASPELTTNWSKGLSNLWPIGPKSLFFSGRLRLAQSANLLGLPGPKSSAASRLLARHIKPDSNSAFTMWTLHLCWWGVFLPASHGYPPQRHWASALCCGVFPAMREIVLTMSSKKRTPMVTKSEFIGDHRLWVSSHRCGSKSITTVLYVRVSFLPLLQRLLLKAASSEESASLLSTSSVGCPICDEVHLQSPSPACN